MSIKYYHLAKDEKLPDEFCAVRDVNGEPSEYTWYERMSDFERELWALFTQSDWFAGSEYRKLQAENAKLRELVKDIDEVADPFLWEFIGRRMRELGIEVEVSE